MRRLPVFFVLDCSESMVGENLRKMEQGLQSIVTALRGDPHALETVYLSVIAFAGVARTIVPLIELMDFYPPRLPLGGGTSLGAALDTLMHEIDRQVVRTTADAKGDWKPIVFLMTDGHPTDDPQAAIDRWRQTHARAAQLVAVGMGSQTDFSALARLTDQVLLFEDSRPGDFKRLIDWVSASVVARSQRLGEPNELSLTKSFDERVLSLVKDAPTTHADDNCVVLVGRCQKHRRPYLIKYEREERALSTVEFNLPLSSYQLAGCYPLDESYFDWSDPRTSSLKVNTAELMGAPGCPHCGNATAFAVCGCGKLLCLNGPGEAICPWCEKTVAFAPGASDAGGFDVGRSQG
ncbi:putative protein encoded in toxicity protection [Thiorhodovibrio winogradskyi]|uniref:VWFA domain-containing protein n=1 Tax=Thiorhodovibrio winogradskyi TaxID=77007 RepID=A0ABZ0SJM5_9GAMM|nr:TerY-C metal binding domain-containing protein [Thiorhodovibrio winogradskyi]